MDERLQFIQDAQRDRFTMADLCARYAMRRRNHGAQYATSPLNFGQGDGCGDSWKSPFLFGHGTHLYDKVERPAHLTLSAASRIDSGTMVLDYKRGDKK